MNFHSDIRATYNVGSGEIKHFQELKCDSHDVRRSESRHIENDLMKSKSRFSLLN